MATGMRAGGAVMLNSQAVAISSQQLAIINCLCPAPESSLISAEIRTAGSPAFGCIVRDLS